MAIKQIIPAGRGFVIRHSELGSREVIAWALMDNGDVFPLTSGDAAGLIPITDEDAYVLSPSEGWEYKLTSKEPPDGTDWEPILMSESMSNESDSRSILWRKMVGQ